MVERVARMTMTLDTAHALCAATSAFYAREAASFSATRGAAWPGWRRVADEARPTVEAAVRAGRAVRVLDVACGNLRFVRFLAEAFPQVEFEVVALDNCTALLPGDVPPCAVRFVPVDLMAALETMVACDPGDFAIASARSDACANLSVDADGDAVAPEFATVLPDVEPGTFDLAVSFGFLHHIPLPAWRRALMRALAGALRPGGVAAVSCWQFLNSPKLAAKARAATARGCAQLHLPSLPEGDFLLGWQDDERAFRYCHHFSDDEVAALAADAARALDGRTPPAATDPTSRRPLAAPTSRALTFHADGRTGDLNAYIVLHA